MRNVAEKVAPGVFAEMLLKHVKDPPIPVVSVAQALKIGVDLSEEEPRALTALEPASARITIPARLEGAPAVGRYLIAKGIESVLYGEVGESALSLAPGEFADAVLVPGRVLDKYGPLAAWDAEELAVAFGVPADAVRRRLVRGT